MPMIDFPASWGLSPLLKDVPFNTREDVLAILPEWMRDTDSAVLNAFCDAMLKAFAIYVSDGAAYAGSTDPVYASGDELDYLGDMRGMPRSDGETDSAYRVRVLNDDQIATPVAIMSAVKSIIAPFSNAEPYYFETPDDEIFVGLHSDTDTDGYYFSIDIDPIDASWRQWSSRPNSRPQHGLVWGKYRDPGTATTLGDKVFTNPSANNDYTDAFNSWAHAVIAIPQFRLPGTLSTTDAIVFTESDAEVAEAALVDAVAEVWLESSLEGYESSSLDFGSEVYTLGGDGALVVESIDKLIVTRAACPVEVHILLDPLL